MTIHIVLSIAGTDPTGGAGVQADIKAFTAIGAYGVTAAAAVVAQNTCGVRSFVPLDPSFVGKQIDAVFDDVRVDAVKIGIVANAANTEVVADRLRQHEAENIVLGNGTKSGDHLLDNDAVAAVRDTLVPLASIITPNLPEAAVLLDTEEATTWQQMHDQGTRLRSLGSPWVLLRADTSRTRRPTSTICGPGGARAFTAARVETLNDHGTGCTLSSAIASLLPDHSAQDSARQAERYLHDALIASDLLDVGHGHGPVHHFHQLCPRE